MLTRTIQWEFRPCGAGFIIKNVSSGSFLAVEDLQGIHVESSVEVVTGDFPTCWEMEVLDNGSAEDDEGENEDVYARYVKVFLFCHAKDLTRSSYQYTAAALRDGLGLQGRLRRCTGTFIRIRDCPPFLSERHDTAFPDKRREQHEHILATARAAARAGREESTHLEHRDRPARRGDEPDNDHDRDDDDDENGNADHDGRRMMAGTGFLSRL